MSETLLTVTDNTFETEIDNSKGIVLVDFWAEWCGPCKMFTLVLEETAKELGSKAKIVKLNIEDSPESTKRFGVHAIPLIILFKNGVEYDRKAGIQGKSEIVNWVRGI